MSEDKAAFSIAAATWAEPLFVSTHNRRSIQRVEDQLGCSQPTSWPVGQRMAHDDQRQVPRTAHQLGARLAGPFLRRPARRVWGYRGRPPEVVHRTAFLDVICNRDQIIGIGELKYWPRVPSQALDIEKDLTTFELALGAAELELTNDRYLGEAVKGGNRALSLAPNAVFCWRQKTSSSLGRVVVGSAGGWSPWICC